MSESVDIERELRGQHPMLIDRKSGTMFEWITDAANEPHIGYANADDHDWVWDREALESDPNLDLVEFASVSNAELGRLAAEHGWSDSTLSATSAAGRAAVTGYFQAVMSVLGDALRPDDLEEYGEYLHRPADGPQALVPGFRLGWRAPDAWPYGVRVRWDLAHGWIFHEPGVWKPQKLVDELVPYPELVAAAVIQLLDLGPDLLPLTGATRWRDGDALMASLGGAVSS